MSTITAVLQNLEAVLKHFTLQELCDLAVQEFPETTWDKIKELIIIHSEPLNNKNVIKIILNIAKDNISKEELEHRISNLRLIVIGKSVRKTWISFLLTDSTPVPKRDALENIKSSIRRTGILANINLVKYNNKYILSVEKKIITKKRGIKKQFPIFFQFFSNEPYIFSSRKVVENKMMSAIAESLGYLKWKVCNLSGPNTTDLLTLLKNKKSGSGMASLLFSEPQLNPRLKITNSASEFGQREERENYAKQIFGETPPQLQSLSVTLKDVTWQQIGDFDKMNGTSLNGVKLTFKAPNVVEQIKEMIRAGVISNPIPEYIRAILYTGRNELKITHDN